ncbi:MAG: hypothetical protein WC468_00740 [Candidatus Paceibacterota bacterium]
MNLKIPNISNSLRVFVVFLFSLSLLAGNAYAADPVFNSLSNDLETLTLENRTTNPNANNPGGANWRDPISASGGDAVSFDVYYHNTVVGTTATNTRLRIYYPGAASNTLNMTGSIISDNAAQVNDTGTINVSSSQSITFEGTAYWYPNQTTTNPISLNVTNTGTYVEVNIGSVAGGWSSQGNVVFRANLSNNAPNPNNPVVDAGANVTINEGQSTSLLATATDPNSLAMTYSWSCNGGNLTSSTVLNPVFNAPSVSVTTTYACTFTATNVNSYSGSDTVYITVLNIDGGSGGNVYSGYGGPELNVTLSANPSSGSSPLNAVDLVATVNSIGLSGYPIRYSFDCENNNSWELTVETRNTNYTAYDLCNYYYDDTYTAKVKVEQSGFIAYSQATIIAGQKSSSGYYGISVDAGPGKDIGENQSVILNGSAYSQFGYGLSYYWSCNGGSLSSANSLTPTYYAPSVSTDIVYTCTLYATDTRGYKNSDIVNITVRNTGVGTNDGNLKISTDSPTNITGSAATLNGSVIADGNQPVNVRFNWGKLSSYNNFTPWISNKHSGQSFNYYVSGLEKGKAYHYRVEASNGKEVVVGADTAFVTKPDSVSAFSATGISSNQISLAWNPGNASCYTMILRKTGGYPLNSGDGSVVYYGNGRTFIDTNLSNNVWYYYRAWAVACDEGLYSFSEGQSARAYTVAASSGQSFVQTTVESGISAEALARDLTQNEIAWQSSILSSPDDEVEFKAIITPTGGKSLSDVVLKTVLSDKIDSVSDIKINEEGFSGSIDEIKLGTVALGETKIITFKAKIASRDNFSYGSNELVSSFEVSAGDVPSVKKEVDISVSRNIEAEAGLISFIDWRIYSGILTFLFIILCLIMMWLLIDRKKGKECLTEKAASTKVEKSRYFNIK